MKKCLVAVAFALVMCFALTPAMAQNYDPYAGQAAISQADIDNYVKIYPELAAVAADPAKLTDVYAQAGWDQMRGSYVIAKINTAYTMLKAPDQADAMTAQLPESMKPTKDELDLVKKNEGAIDKAYGL